jgi:hypothetical protein
MFAFLIECWDVFVFKLKMLRKFNILTAEPLNSNVFDFFTAAGLRQWIVGMDRFVLTRIMTKRLLVVLYHSRSASFLLFYF